MKLRNQQPVQTNPQFEQGYNTFLRLKTRSVVHTFNPEDSAPRDLHPTDRQAFIKGFTHAQEVNLLSLRLNADRSAGPYQMGFDEQFAHVFGGAL